MRLAVTLWEGQVGSFQTRVVAAQDKARSFGGGPGYNIWVEQRELDSLGQERWRDAGAEATTYILRQVLGTRMTKAERAKIGIKNSRPSRKSGANRQRLR